MVKLYFFYYHSQPSRQAAMSDNHEVVTAISPQLVGEVSKIRSYVLICALLSIFFTAFAYGNSGTKEILTTEERLWLTNNQSRIVLAVETGYAPFVFLDSKGQPTGLAQDYIHLLESKVGVHFKQERFSSLDDIFKKVHSGDVQIVNAVTKTPQRSAFLAFTEPFVSVPNVIVVRKDRSGQMREENLSGLRVSLVKSYAVTEKLTHKSIVFVPDLVPDDLTALLNVSFGRSDAAVIDLATASYLITQKGITNLRVAGETPFDIRLSMGTPIDEPILISILQKGLGAITETERQEIHNRWINASRQSIFTDRRFWIAAGSVLFVVLVIIAGILVWNRMLRKQLVERIAAERKLAESEQRFRTVADYTYDWEYWLGPNREILFMSPSCERVTGYSQAEFDADPDLLNRIVLPADRNLMETHQSEYTHLDQSLVDFRIVRRDGNIRWITHGCRPVYGSDGQFMGRRISNRDDTERRQAEEALRLTRFSLEVSSDALFWIAPDARIVDVNAAACRSLGYTREELLQLRVPDLDAHYNEELWSQHFAELRQCGSMTFESEHRTKDGRLFPVEIVANHVVYGSEERNCAFVRDITKRKQTEQALVESENRFSLFMDTLPAAAFIKDEDGTTLYANRYMSDVIGVRDWFGKSTRDLFSPEMADKMIVDDQRSLEAGYLVTEEQVPGTDGKLRFYQTHKFKIPRQGKPPLLGGISVDITEHKQMEDQIFNLAYFDPLTNLPNRRMLLDRLGHALSQAKRYERSLAIMFLDLDNFKKINDTLGHDVGDELLKEVATRLNTCVRTGDTVSRQGGDEFIIVLSEIAHPDDAAQVADKIIEAINVPVQVADNTLNASTSIGIAVYPINGSDDAQELMKKADKAMYAAKKAGRNGYKFFVD